MSDRLFSVWIYCTNRFIFEREKRYVIIFEEYEREGNMKKIDPTVIAETRYIAAFVLVLSLLMQAVFLFAHSWDYTVLLGNILSASVSILNFFLLGLTVTKAMTKDARDMGQYMKLSKTYRFLLIILVCGIGLYFKCFNDIAVIVPVFFPHVAIFARGIALKKNTEAAEGGEQDAV